MSDFENAALTVFLSLLTRAILTYKIDLRMPISLVNNNMERAQKKNTLIENKFHFPKKIFSNIDAKNETRQMSMDEIINGSVS